jgi:hypothetical protein
MLEVFREKVETIAEEYADLVEKTITEAKEAEVLEREKLNEINEGIRLLNYVANTIERIDRLNRWDNLDLQETTQPVTTVR